MKELIKFLQARPRTDEEMHKKAEELGIPPDKLEAMVYRLAHCALTGKNLKGSEVLDSEFKAEDLAEGVRVEREHTDNPAVAKSIAKAHLLEDKDYYRKLKKAGL